MMRPPLPRNSLCVENHIAAFVDRFVPKNGAVDSLLSVSRNELSPDEKRIPIGGQQNSLLTWPNKQFRFSAISVTVTGIVPVENLLRYGISISGLIPELADFTQRR